MEMHFLIVTSTLRNTADTYFCVDWPHSLMSHELVFFCFKPCVLHHNSNVFNLKICAKVFEEPNHEIKTASQNET
jgi:hypothetical protein